MNRKKILIVLIVLLIVFGFFWIKSGIKLTGNVVCEGEYCNLNEFDLSWVAKHNLQEDCWTTINGKVYDLTDFVLNHPGGEGIVKLCGIDGSEIYPHDGSRLDKYYIGDLV